MAIQNLDPYFRSESTLEEFYDEVDFQVGERVDVDLTGIPEQDRDTTTGVITQIRAQFYQMQNMKTIWYLISFDGDYVKSTASKTITWIPRDFWVQQPALSKIPTPT